MHLPRQMTRHVSAAVAFDQVKAVFRLTSKEFDDREMCKSEGVELCVQYHKIAADV